MPPTMTTNQGHATVRDRVLPLVQEFYANNRQIKESHGIVHAMAVHNHAVNAIKSANQNDESCNGLDDAMEIEAAALLHDVDDSKYFPNNEKKENARTILEKAGIPSSSVDLIVQMIGWVSGSTNGNKVPSIIQETGNYRWLIPRWADRLEAVGVRGVVRCYLYSVEHNQLLSSPESPRATTEEQVWELANPARFERYCQGNRSTDMMSHYYDKLLHVARPPPDIVRNQYLESKAMNGAGPLVEICIRFGKTGVVDEDYIQSLEK